MNDYKHKEKDVSDAVSENEDIYGDVFQGIRERNSDLDRHSDTSESDDDDTETNTDQKLNTLFSRFTSIVKEASAIMGMGEDKIITRWMNHRGKPYKKETYKPSVRSETERKLRGLISEMAEEAGVPITSKKRIPWGKLLNILADSGYCINNYPDISIPGGTAVDFGKYKPLRYLPLEERNKLINAIFSKDHPCTFRPYRSRTVRDIRALRRSEAPIIMFMPPHTSSSKGKRGKRMFLNGSVDFNGHRPCKKQCDCVGDGFNETNKKRKKVYEDESYLPERLSRKRRLQED
ncbi:hypothetical protein F5887DRAFT_999507 [Amanita rubescens]|nr:hypothetical protein F5887DRAFT_999507 [Amanita rubescens]